MTKNPQNLCGNRNQTRCGADFKNLKCLKVPEKKTIYFLRTGDIWALKVGPHCCLNSIRESGPQITFHCYGFLHIPRAERDVTFADCEIVNGGYCHHEFHITVFCIIITRTTLLPRWCEFKVHGYWSFSLGYFYYRWLCLKIEIMMKMKDKK